LSFTSSYIIDKGIMYVEGEKQNSKKVKTTIQPILNISKDSMT